MLVPLPTSVLAIQALPRVSLGLKYSQRLPGNSPIIRSNCVFNLISPSIQCVLRMQVIIRFRSHVFCIDASAVLLRLRILLLEESLDGRQVLAVTELFQCVQKRPDLLCELVLLTFVADLEHLLQYVVTILILHE